MRVQTDGIKRHTQPFEFRFDGKTIDAYPGDTIASALIASGILGFCVNRQGEQRGVFCGMGVCGDCRVLIGGRSRRACVEPARENLEVSRYPSRPTALSREPDKKSSRWRELRPDVLIVGAGPAGLSAAKVAAAAGLDVLVVDERHKAGGQYFKQPSDGFDVDFTKVDARFAEGHELMLEVQDAGARFIFGATVWGTFAPNRVAISTDEHTTVIDPRQLILSPGAYERTLPVPGWTLPGFLTAGAAQTLLRANQTAVGRRVLVAGHGPLNMQVAHELAAAGTSVAAVAEIAAAPYTAAPGALFGMIFNAPQLSFTGLAQLASLRRKRVPVRYRHVLVGAEGGERVRRAVIARIDARGRPVAGTQEKFDVDAICVNYGFLPQSELARSLGCQFRYDNRTGNLDAVRGDDGRTNVENVFVVGDAGGMGGALISMDQGTLAGLSVVAALRPSFEVASKRSQHERSLRRHRKFQDALWRVFDAPYIGARLADLSTPICRCEGINKIDIESCLTVDQRDFGSVKRATRLGMGRCQGRYCSTLLASLMSDMLGHQCDMEEFFAPRAPFKPVPVMQLAGEYGKALTPVDLLQSRDE
jgi:thioredoxin reductase